MQQQGQGRRSRAQAPGPAHCWASQDAFVSSSQTVTGAGTGGPDGRGVGLSWREPIMPAESSSLASLMVEMPNQH